jgi:hypothetical protein
MSGAMMPGCAMAVRTLLTSAACGDQTMPFSLGNGGEAQLGFLRFVGPA